AVLDEQWRRRLPTLERLLLPEARAGARERMEGAFGVDGHQPGGIEIDARSGSQLAAPGRATGGGVETGDAALPGGRTDFTAADQRRAHDVGDALDLVGAARQSDGGFPAQRAVLQRQRDEPAT